MDAQKIAEYKMRCLEIAAKVSPNNSEMMLSIAKKLYEFLEIN